MTAPDSGSLGQRPGAVSRIAVWLAFVLVLVGLVLAFRPPGLPAWTNAEMVRIQSLALSNLPALPPAPDNAVADLLQAQQLGHQLFFDTRLSANGAVSCATCHQPERRFSDGLPRSVGLGLGDFNAPSLVGAAYSPWLFWNGRADSLWAQAMHPLENPKEQGLSRLALVRLLRADAGYRAAYTALFGPLPGPGATPEAATRVLVNTGKALAAYQRLLLPGATPFDGYARRLPENPEPDASFPREAVLGLKLFIGEGQCLNCHNGPLLTNQEFHNTGPLPAPYQLPDPGRIAALDEVSDSPFNCLGAYADATDSSCAELRFMRRGEALLAARRTPSLRNLGGTEPYFHAGQMASLADVLRHYNRAADAIVGHNEAKPLNLLPYQLRRLEAFLNTLDAPPATAPGWLAAPAADQAGRAGVSRQGL